MVPKKIGKTEFYTLEEISKKLQTTPRTLREYIRDGFLHAQKIAGRWVITAEALDDFLNAKSGSVAGTRKKKKATAAAQPEPDSTWEPQAPLPEGFDADTQAPGYLEALDDFIENTRGK